MKHDGRRILSLSEFGGYGLKVEGHMYSDKAFGYKNFKEKKDLEKALKELYDKVRLAIKELGLGVAVYTELTDVEEELNGLLTYDRKIQKCDSGVLKSLNEALYLEYQRLSKRN